MTCPNQPGNVALRGMIGDARHGDRVAPGLAPGGEGDVHQLRRFLGVFVEQLVEIPHAVEHQFIGVLALDLQVLLHHWGVLG